MKPFFFPILLGFLMVPLGVRGGGSSGSESIITGQFIPNPPHSSPKGGKISGLRWTSEKEIPVLTEEKGLELQSFAVLHGTYRHPRGNLIYNSKKIGTNENGEFQLKIPLKSKTLVLDLIAVNPQGGRERETFYLLFANWRPPLRTKGLLRNN